MVETPSAPRLHGHMDIITPMLIAGWVRDQTAPTRRLELHLIQDGAVRAVAKADMMRPELAGTGFGDGAHGFEFHALSPDHPLAPGPAAIRDALDGAVIPEGTFIIPGEALAAMAPEPPAPRRAPEPQLQGLVDQVSAGLIIGWVRDQVEPSARLELHMLQDGQLIAAAIADEPRADLVQAGLGDGSFGFTLHDLLPEQPWKPGAASIHDARTGAVIPGGSVILPEQGGARAVFNWPALGSAPGMPTEPPPPEPVVAEVAPSAPAPVEDAAPPSTPEPTATEAAPPAPAPAENAAPPSALEPLPTAVPAPEPPTPAAIPKDALRQLLPAESALKTFAIELAMQAYDAPAQPAAAGAFSPADAMAYFAMVRRYRPRQVIEFGSGDGTPFALAALQANGQGRLLQVADVASSLPKVEQLAEPVTAITGTWLAGRVTTGDMVVVNPGLGAEAALDILQRLLPACAAGLHVHLHGLPLLTGEFPPGQHGMDAHALMQALIGNRRISVLYATEWHAVHNPAGLDALMRGRSAGGGGSLWLLHRPER